MSEIENIASTAIDGKDINIDGINALFVQGFWEEYLLSYGQALAQFNIGSARAMQENILETSTTCFQKALLCGSSIQHIFDVNMYEHRSLNLPDFVNLISILQVKALD